MGENAAALSRKNRILLFLIISGVIIFLLAFQYLVQMRSYKEQAYQTATVLTNQVKEIIASNKREDEALLSSVKEDYITRAKAVAYITDRNSDIEYDIAELVRVAGLISVDEIHLFDEDGVIYGGTVPKYYGYSFDSGEQMAYFKPMLEDKSLSMCQDVTPNTAEAKSMMYAICWNDDGTRMIQVGIEPLRLIDELRSNEISEVVAGMPAYEGVEIIIADTGTGEILGSTISGQIGENLSDIGIKTDKYDLTDYAKFEAEIDGAKSYCEIYGYGEYIIAITQNKAVVNKNIFVTMIMVFIYLLFAEVAIYLIVKRMASIIIGEQKNANTDHMTEFLNRRAYENDLLEYEKENFGENFVYVSMDLNGLKVTNDNFGHDAGDKLIKGAAQCMRQCFGSYGKLYRMGGDEFAALIYADNTQLEKIKQDFINTMKEWSVENDMNLSVSCGYVQKHELPDKDIYEIAKVADARMYQEKEAYYKRSENDRRKGRRD